VGNMSTNVYAKFRYAALRIKKALGIFRELITTTTTTTTNRVAFQTRLPGLKTLSRHKTKKKNEEHTHTHTHTHTYKPI